MDGHIWWTSEILNPKICAWSLCDQIWVSFHYIYCYFCALCLCLSSDDVMGDLYFIDTFFITKKQFEQTKIYPPLNERICVFVIIHIRAWDTNTTPYSLDKKSLAKVTPSFCQSVQSCAVERSHIWIYSEKQKHVWRIRRKTAAPKSKLQCVRESSDEPNKEASPTVLCWLSIVCARLSANSSDSTASAAHTGLNVAFLTARPVPLHPGAGWMAKSLSPHKLCYEFSGD